MCITPEQSRAARGLLNWSQRELVERSGVSQKAIADFERGVSAPYLRTLRDIVAAFEAVGIRFIEPEEGITGLGVAFKWGAKPIGNTMGEQDAATTGKNGEVLDAHVWDDDFDDFTSDQPAVPYIIPISDTDRAILRQRFAEHPDAWNKLSDRAKAVYSRELGLNEQEIERHADH